MADVTFVDGAMTVDGAACDPKSVVALISRGATHLFGSEASSKLIGKVRKALVDGWVNGGEGGRVAKDAPEFSKDDIKSYREANPDKISEWAKEIEAEFVKALIEGTLGVRTGGTPVDPLEAEIEKAAKEWVRQMLEAREIRPKQYAKGQPVTLGDQVMTFEEMVARRIKRDRDNLEKQARKALADKARKAEKAKEAAKAATTLADIGL